MKFIQIGFCLVVFFSAVGCSWPPIPAGQLSASEQANAEKAKVAFQDQQKLAQYFDEAVAYAVFPNTIRAGTGFGGGFGGGWLYRDDQVVGRTAMLQLSAGANFGIQWYRQILFFKTEAALEKFKRGSFEFLSQANVAAGAWGAAATPSYHPEVALFTQLQAGLLLEGSVGTHRYEYKPLAKPAVSTEYSDR